MLEKKSSDVNDPYETSGTSPSSANENVPVDESNHRVAAQPKTQASSAATRELVPAAPIHFVFPASSPAMITPTDPHRHATAFLQSQGTREGRHTIRYWRGEWYRWEGTHYVALTKEDLRSNVTRVAQIVVQQIAREDRLEKMPKVTRALVENTIQAIAAELNVPADAEEPLWLDGDPRPPHFLSMANGLVDLDALISGASVQVHPHTPSWFTLVSLPFDFDPNATCPLWERFLDHVLEHDKERIALLQEWFGYCLTYDTSQHKFLMLEGEGANGKSVVLDILAAMLGEQNVSHVPLEIFGQRFQLTATVGKLANIAAEVGEIGKVEEGLFKAFVAGDRMYFDRKNREPIHAWPTARLVFATNNRPKFSDGSDGIWRRMMLLPFQVTILPGAQDKQLTEKLRAELPGIFSWAIKGLKRLKAQGHFTEPRLSVDALNEFRRESNPARLFLTENYVPDACAEVPAAEVYSAYQKWCNTNGFRPVPETTFGKEVGRVFPGRKRQRRSIAPRAYVYVGLKAITPTVTRTPVDLDELTKRLSSVEAG